MYMAWTFVAFELIFIDATQDAEPWTFATDYTGADDPLL